MFKKKKTSEEKPRKKSLPPIEPIPVGDMESAKVTEVKHNGGVIVSPLTSEALEPEVEKRLIENRREDGTERRTGEERRSGEGDRRKKHKKFKLQDRRKGVWDRRSGLDRRFVDRRQDIPVKEEIIIMDSQRRPIQPAPSETPTVDVVDEYLSKDDVQDLLQSDSVQVGKGGAPVNPSQGEVERFEIHPVRYNESVAQEAPQEAPESDESAVDAVEVQVEPEPESVETESQNALIKQDWLAQNGEMIAHYWPGEHKGQEALHVEMITQAEISLEAKFSTRLIEVIMDGEVENLSGPLHMACLVIHNHGSVSIRPNPAEEGHVVCVNSEKMKG